MRAQHCLRCHGVEYAWCGDQSRTGRVHSHINRPFYILDYSSSFILAQCAKPKQRTVNVRNETYQPHTCMLCCVWRRCVLLFWIRTSSTTMVTLIYFCLYDAYYVQTSRIAASIFLLLTLLVRQHTKRSRARRQTVALQWRKKKCGWCRNIA